MSSVRGVAGKQRVVGNRAVITILQVEMTGVPLTHPGRENSRP